MIEVFKRKAYRLDGNGTWVPHGGARRTHIQMVETRDEARAICRPHNATRPTSGNAHYSFTFYEFDEVH